MMRPVRVVEILGGLRLMKFFPGDECALLALARIVSEMCGDELEVQWLVGRALELYPEWPGIPELRACYCSRYKPRDGINAYSSVYPDGIPSERPQPPPLPALPPGRKVTADAELDLVLGAVTELFSMPAPRPPVYPNPNAPPITQADVDRVLAERHRQKEPGP